MAWEGKGTNKKMRKMHRLERNFDSKTLGIWYYSADRGEEREELDDSLVSC